MKSFRPVTISAFRTPAALLFLTAVALLAYASTFEAPFVFDDLPNITENPHIRMTAITPERIADILNSPNPRPLANLTMAFNYYFHRYDVRGYHAVNFLIHLCTALLVFLVARPTLRLCGIENMIPPLLAATLWVVNPVHTQSVTYIIQRMNSLSTMFYMLALFCYIQARISATAGRSLIRRRLFYALCLISGIFALASKEIAATLPVMIFLYEWYFFQNLDRAWLKKKLPWIGLAALTLLIVAVLYLGASPIEKILKLYEEKQNFTPAQRLLTEPAVVIYYLSLLFFPHPLRLNVDYDFPISFSPLEPAVTILAMAALLALLAAALYRPGRNRLLSFAVLWFLVNLALESSFIGLALIFEHRTYLPSIFLVLTATALTARHLPRPVFFTVLGLLIMVSTVWTYQRNILWNDTLALWLDCAHKSPRHARPANGVGMAFQTHNQPEKAMEWFQKAVLLDPEYDEAYSNIGGILIKLNRPQESLPHLEKAISLNPEGYEAFSNMGSALQRLNQIEAAIAYYRKSISIYSNYEIAHNNLGAALAEKGETDGAIRHLNRAIRINPGYPEPYSNLGLAMTKQGHTREAINYYRKALKLDPELFTAHFNLGTACFQKNDLDCARHHLQQAARLDPDSVLTFNNLAAVLVIEKKYDQAADTLARLAELRPESPTARYNLACVYALRGKNKEAVKYLKQAVALGYDRWDRIRTDPDLENIRETDYYKGLTK